MNQPTTPNTVEDFLPLPKPKFWSKDHPFEDLFTADQVRAAILADRAQYAKGVKSGMDFLIAEVERLTGLVVQRPTVAGSVDTPEFQKRFAYMLREEYAELVAYIDSRRTADTPLAAGDRTKTLQFLTDVVTAAGLLSCGKTDKGLAKRISADAYDLRAALFATSTPAAPVVAEGLTDDDIEELATDYYHGQSDAIYNVIGFARAILAANPVASSPLATEAIDLILHCPACGLQHVDEPDERTPNWSNPQHRSHLCHGCGHTWRPADVPTNGVKSINTKGKSDSLATAAPVPASEAANEPIPVWELFADGWDGVDDLDGDWLQTLPIGTKLYYLAAPAAPTDKKG